ncbi:MAG: DUF2905 domain-containing protein [candidate division WOR-3 bacterium]|nr:DUF2905 domain-containing protein [candidate division WOR-3 bacterium]MCX7947786.1 DUF2905 domain-containing protein [candidate division WOR-3 bacterium]MDW8150743.1 DUF2905 family protein [candidate division WOR-3 bacterium]
MFSEVSKLLIIIGFIFIIVGLIFLFLPKFKLPGDILIQKDNFTFYFPLGTSILLSIILSIILTIIFFLFRK